MIHQKAGSVFDLEEFQPILNTLHKLTHVNNLPTPCDFASEKVVADHLRGLFYLVANGAPPPGKNGRERIVKMLIRRVITRLIVLHIDVQKFISVLVNSIANNITDIDYKEVASASLIEYFLSENEKFMATIQRGKRQLMTFLTENHGNSLSNQQIYCLEKKWGLPSVLTEFILHQQEWDFAESGHRATSKAIINKNQESTVLGG
jgi:alanyl-tRNA synthetase